MPSVSVVIPVYRVEPYMARCARSLFKQSLEDIEYIFIDDCSPDHSIDIMKAVLEEEFPARKPQVRVFRMPQNSGQAQVRMQGISLATGDYVIQCDSDDEVDADAYRLMYQKAIDEDLDIVTSDFRLLGLKNPRIQSQASEPGREIADILSGKVWGSVCCRLIRKELLNDMITPKADMWEDVVFSVFATSKAMRIGHVAKPLYYYHRRNSSICFSGGLANAISRSESIAANVSIVLDYLSGVPNVIMAPSDVVSFKYRARDPLLPYVHLKEYYHKWLNTFPEVDSSLIKAKGISLETKFWFILIHLHLYHPWKTVTGCGRKCFARLLSKQEN